MRFSYFILVLVFVLLSCQAVQAKDEGFYIGGSLGLATVQQSGTDPEWGYFEIDDSDTAYKIFGGYQFSPIFALEGGYRNLGKPSSSAAKTELQGLDVFGIAGVPLGPVRIFGKLGGIYWDANTRIDGEKAGGKDGFDFGAGAGVEFELGSLGLRGEVEYFDVLSDTWMYSIGATFTF
jgi:hypothetical protein